MPDLPGRRLTLPRLVRTLTRGAADFVYPPVGRLCTAELPSSAVPPASPFCDACRQQLLMTRGPACLRCASSIGPYLNPRQPCSLCRDERFAFERVIRLGVYDGALRTACLRCKERGAEPLATGIGDLLWECEADALREAGADVVVPVPQHWIRRIYRPHHAAETLAAAWSARLKVPLASHI